MSETTTRTDAGRSVYLDGRIVLAEEASVSLEDRGLLYGFGFFETFRTSGGRAHHWAFNLARLKRACGTAGLKLPSSFLSGSEPRLQMFVEQLLVRNGESDGVFRYTVTAGGPNGPSEFMTLRRLPAAAPDHGVALRVLNLRRDSGEWIPRPKSLNYMNAALGHQEVRRRSQAESDEGLFMSGVGNFVVETARQNLVWIKGERLFTPDPSVGSVAGTCLDWIAATGSPVQSVRAHLEDLITADAVVCVNSVRGITAVCEIWDQTDATRLARLNSHAHPIVTNLQSKWAQELVLTRDASNGLHPP
jgi:4-amino-4-deoxychorismate lyase